MIENNLGQEATDQYDDAENINSSLGSAEEDQQNFSSSDGGNVNDGEDNPLTQASDDDEETKDQTATNVADKNKNTASSYHDNSRVTTTRANEANDRLDTGSGGLSAGGVKSATDL